MPHAHNDRSNLKDLNIFQQLPVNAQGEIDLNLCLWIQLRRGTETSTSSPFQTAWPATVRVIETVQHPEKETTQHR